MLDSKLTCSSLPFTDWDGRELDARLVMERVDICPAHYTSTYSPDPVEIAEVMARSGKWAAMSRDLDSLGIGEKESAFLQMLWSGRAGLYDYFPYLFLDAFPEVDTQAVRDLASSARLCFTAIVLTDRVTDQVYTPRPRLLIETNRMYVAAVRLLCRQFSFDSPFWDYFDARFQEQARALALESERHFRTWSSYSFEEMKAIARGKAALGKYVIAGLGMLAGAMDRVEPLTASYDLYYTGYQLFDDVCDWKEDYKRQIYSYLITQAVEQYRADKRDESVLPTPEELGQMICAGLGKLHLRQADDYFAQAVDVLGEYGCRLWRGMIDETRNRCLRLSADLAEIAEQQFCRHQKRKLGPLAARKVHPTSPSLLDDAALKAAQSAAVDFLLNSQHLEGYWKDFWGAPGVSTDWVTGYVGLTLADHSAQCRPQLEAARDWVLGHRRPTGGWGYNENVNADLDSTAYCMLFLHALQEEYPQVRQDLEVILAHQDLANGGFRTYLPAALPDPNNAGWCSTEPSVSSVAVWVLSRLAPDLYRSEVTRAAAHLTAQQTTEGYWHAYWWNGTAYSTAMALQALTVWGHPDRMVMNKAVNWLLRTRKPEGGWGEASSEGQGQPFATAMAVRALLVADPSLEVGTAIRRAVSWLLVNQLEDGSWVSYPIMRIPEPDVLTPWDARSFPAKKLKLAEDSRRVFTTATVLTALTQYAASMANFLRMR